jgi:hypothetical protein
MEVNAQVKSKFAPQARRVVAGFSCAVLLVAASACTDDPKEPEAAPSPSTSVGSARTLEAKPVPLKIRVTRVAGKLSKKQRESLERSAGSAIRRYFDAAWLGESRRSSVAKAFSSFSKGAAQKASADRNLMTNAGLGTSIESIATKEKVAYLSVLAPNKVAAGVTARFRLRFVAEKADTSEQKVTVAGRLLLTRKRSGGWQIFGYDVRKSVVPTGTGAS